jgi:SAM-dependent methyltransferase
MVERWILDSWLFRRMLRTRRLKDLMFRAWMFSHRRNGWDVAPGEGYLQGMGDALKHRYDQKLDVWTDLPGDREPGRWFLERLPPGPHHILDIGTGRGRDLELFLAKGHRATGLDLFEIDNWPDLRARWGDKLTLSATPFLSFQPGERFTAMLTVGGLGHQHPAEYDAFLAHARELLAPGGLFLLMVTHEKSERGPGELLFTDDRFWRFFTTRELRDLLEGAGFRWVDSFSHHDSFFPYLMAMVTH